MLLEKTKKWSMQCKVVGRAIQNVIANWPDPHISNDHLDVALMSLPPRIMKHGKHNLFLVVSPSLFKFLFIRKCRNTVCCSKTKKWSMQCNIAGRAIKMYLQIDLILIFLLLMCMLLVCHRLSKTLNLENTIYFWLILEVYAMQSSGKSNPKYHCRSSLPSYC